MPHEYPLPRRVYFGAADKQHLAEKKVSGGPSVHEIEVGRRNKLALTVTQRAEDVVGAIRALRAFDGTGNTEDALDHLQASLQDLNKAHAILVDDVTESIGRYRDRRENETVLAESTAGRGEVQHIQIPNIAFGVLRTNIDEDGDTEQVAAAPSPADIASATRKAARA
ncbi:hypothetical protein SEA_AOKA_34 [Arthrobacter phage Aoka]|nr:hypothetical protein SEA_AOKA_34 [Arthrobacter phage Aoka]